MSKKEPNRVGKKKPTGKLIENFYVSLEEKWDKIKVEHKSGDFNFRVWTAGLGDQYFKAFTEGESAKAFANIFSGIKLFVILCIQNPNYFMDWLIWHNEYFKNKEEAEVSSEAEDEIISQMAATDALVGEELDDNNSEAGVDSVPAE